MNALDTIAALRRGEPLMPVARIAGMDEGEAIRMADIIASRIQALAAMMALLCDEYDHAVHYAGEDYDQRIGAYIAEEISGMAEDIAPGLAEQFREARDAGRRGAA